MKMLRKFGRRKTDKDTERGISLVVVGFGMVFVLGVAGLGIDLASLYVGRVQAQRAADAAALAGAQVFVDTACSSAGTPCSLFASQVKARAMDVGNENLVAGISPNIKNGDIQVDSSVPNDPRVTVRAGRTSANGNPMPTFFVRIFGIATADVAATATAEAYAPNGSGPTVAPNCVKPWMYPNCDFGKPTVAPGSSTGNQYCVDTSGVSGPAGNYYQYLIDPVSSQLEFPGYAPKGSVGEKMQLKPGNPTQAATSSQFYAVELPSGGTFACPSCANNGGGSGGSGSSFSYCISCCYQLPLATGQTYNVVPNTGNMTGPTGSGVDCLINENNGSGQDLIDGINPGPYASLPPALSTFPPAVRAGSNNPYYPGQPQIPLEDSTSMVVVPIYDGHPLCSGAGACAGNNVTLLGFLQVFVVEEDKNAQNSVYGYITNVVSAVNPGTAILGGTPIPVRLIHQ